MNCPENPHKNSKPGGGGGGGVEVLGVNKSKVLEVS